MRIKYEIERKQLARAIGELTGQPYNYLAAPTLNFSVGEYIIDRNGMLVGTKNRGLVAELQNVYGFVPVSQEYDDDAILETAKIPEIDGFVISVPLDGFTPDKLDNLTRMITAKAPLLKIALGVDNLPVKFTEATIEFPWFTGELDGNTVKAYSILISKMCEIAKDKQRVTAREKDVENMKYAFRCWLLSLGFIGDEYKSARKILLAKLSGSSAFKSTESTVS